jgi:hypothetical protein
MSFGSFRFAWNMQASDVNLAWKLILMTAMGRPAPFGFAPVWAMRSNRTCQVKGVSQGSQLRGTWNEKELNMSEETKTEKAKPPVKKINVGSVQASVWQRHQAEGKIFYTASFQLSYKDGEEWKTSSSYGLNDLINLVKVAMLVHSAILELKRASDPVEGEDAE